MADNSEVSKLTLEHQHENLCSFLKDLPREICGWNEEKEGSDRFARRPIVSNEALSVAGIRSEIRRLLPELHSRRVAAWIELAEILFTVLDRVSGKSLPDAHTAVKLVIDHSPRSISRIAYRGILLKTLKKRKYFLKDLPKKIRRIAPPSPE